MELLAWPSRLPGLAWLPTTWCTSALVLVASSHSPPEHTHTPPVPPVGQFSWHMIFPSIKLHES